MAQDEVIRGTRAPGIRRLVFVLAVMAAFGLLLMALALLHMSDLVDEAIHTTIRDTRSRAIASELSVSLLIYHQLTTVQAVTGESELVGTRAQLAAQMRELLTGAARDEITGDEREMLAQVSARLHEYLQRHEVDSEAQSPDLAQAVPASRPAFTRTMQALQTLRDLNDKQVQRAHERALEVQRLARWAVVAATVFMGMSLLMLVVGSHRYLVRPILVLHRAISRLAAGDTNGCEFSPGVREISDLRDNFNQMAERLAQQREDQLTFLAGVAHELRNPLNGLRLGLETLALETGNRQSGAMAPMLHRQVDRLARIVDDLLDAARIEAGNLELQTEIFDLRDCVRDVIGVYAPTSVPHEIHIGLPDTPVFIDADSTRIGQVIGNLLSNAIKYSPEGGRIDVRLERSETSAVLSVTDTGIGIRLEDQEAMFQPFRRHHPTIAQGTGLGLSVVRRIVDAHGGRIAVSSEPGTGTTFLVTLPRLNDAVVDDRLAARGMRH